MIPIVSSLCCPCGPSNICWNRYVSGASKDLAATAPTPLGGHTETSPGSGVFDSDLWSVLNGAATPYGTDNISITGSDTDVLSAVHVDQTSVKFHVQFSDCHNGDLLWIKFDLKADGSEYLRLDFECNNGSPALTLRKYESSTLTKVRRKLNTNSDVTFDGTNIVGLRASLTRGVLLCQLADYSGAGDPSLDKSGAKPKVGGITISDHDDSAFTYRPLVLSYDLPILTNDTAGRFAWDRWAVGGTPASSPFKVTLMDVWNTDRMSADASCWPDYLCGGYIAEYPVKIGLGSDNVVEVGREYVNCISGLSNPYASNPGPPWQVLESCDCDLSNTNVEDFWAPTLSGSPNYCHYEYSNSDTDSCTIFEPCGGGLSRGSSPSITSELNLRQDGIDAYLTYAGEGPIVNTYQIDVGRFWKPSDVEGNLLPIKLFDIATNAVEGLCGYQDQELTCGTFVFEDTD